MGSIPTKQQQVTSKVVRGASSNNESGNNSSNMYSVGGSRVSKVAMVDDGTNESSWMDEDLDLDD